MNNPAPIDEPVSTEAELVAYLDGELPPEQARRVEQRLAEDPVCRERVRELQRAWDLLDELPRATASSEFARSTIEMVAQRAEVVVSDNQQQKSRLPQLRWLGGIAGVIVAAAVGYLVGAYLWKSPDDQLLQDLPVIENVDRYLQAGDLEFLRMLEREHLFDEDSSHAP